MSKKDEGGGWPPQDNSVPCDAPAFRAVEEHAGEMKLSAPVFAAVKQANGWAAGKKVEKAAFEEAGKGFLNAP